MRAQVRTALILAALLAGCLPGFGAPARAEIDCATLAKRLASRASSVPNEARVRELLREILLTNDPAVLEKAYADYRRAVARFKRERPAPLRERDRLALPDWPNREVQYMLYVDQWGIRDGKPGSFDSAIRMLDHAEALGAKLLYLLPFNKSLGIDGGFDVDNYRRVAKSLGGDAAYLRFLAEAKRRGFLLMGDLVLNHTGSDHPWFRRMLAGDEWAMKQFITRRTPPVVVSREPTPKGVMVRYRETDANGAPYVTDPMRVIFPDVVEHHWREVNAIRPDGSPLRFWYLHNFLPVQPDRNWASPDVVRDTYGVIGHWLNRGLDMIRLDAIPYLDKRAENHERTHRIVELLSEFTREVAPSARLMVEAAQPQEKIVAYFGKTGRLRLPTGGEVPIPNEAQVAYAHGFMTNSWSSQLMKDKRYLADYLRQQTDFLAQLPPHTIFAPFHRVHDDLTLKMFDPDVKRRVLELLDTGARGIAHRGGGGIGGRLTPMLENDADRVNLSTALLMSQKGMPIIYFGDEIAAQNDRAYMALGHAERMAAFAKQGIVVQNTPDARLLGRGPLPAQDFERAGRGEAGPLANSVFDFSRRAVAARKASEALLNGDTTVLDSDRADVLSFLRSDARSGEKVVIASHLDDGAADSVITVGDVFGRTSGTVELRDLLTGEVSRYPIADGRIRVTLGRYGSKWLAPLTRP